MFAASYAHKIDRSSGAKRAALGLALTLTMAFTNNSYAQEAIFSDGFEAVVPATDALAARFLTQASFGPTKASIAKP